jgi:integrase
MLEELAWSAQVPDLAHLIRREDIPRAPQRLPRALIPQQDQLIQQELLRRNDLPSNVLLLMRHTGMRIGECVDLAYDCLHNAGPDRWAIHDLWMRRSSHYMYGVIALTLPRCPLHRSPSSRSASLTKSS